MLTTVIVGIVSFLLGAGLVAARFAQRLEQDRQSNPFDTPPNMEVEHFVSAVHAHLHSWRQADWRRSPANVQNVRQALEVLARYSNRPAVWIVENGVVTMQDGTQLPIKLLATHLDEALTAARSPMARANLRSLIARA